MLDYTDIQLYAVGFLVGGLILAAGLFWYAKRGKRGMRK